MSHFFTLVDLRNKSQMVDFLSKHFRYDTMNSWNRTTSYANKVKIHTLGLTADQTRVAYDLLDCREPFRQINDLFHTFAIKHQYSLQAGFNGRSGGYIVLYQGGLNYKNAHTAECDACGKRTYHKVDIACTTGGCDGKLNVLPAPIPQPFTQPGLGMDKDEDFAEWTLDNLRYRVRIVQDFDRLCDDVRDLFIDLCDNYEVVPETILVPKTINTLQARTKAA